MFWNLAIWGTLSGVKQSTAYTLTPNPEQRVPHLNFKGAAGFRTFLEPGDLLSFKLTGGFNLQQLRWPGFPLLSQSG